MFKKATIFIMCCFLSGALVVIHAQDDVYLGGDSIGIDIRYDGIMVSGTYSFRIDGVRYDPSNTFQQGDVIQSIGGVKVHSIAEMYHQIHTYQNNVNQIDVVIVRNGDTKNVVMQSVYDAKQQRYTSGIYVKDSIIGVGTTTFYDPQSHRYAALGHAIYDVGSKQLVPIHLGTIYPAKVTSIQKAQDNVPGEKHAEIDDTSPLGDVRENTDIGIYGHYDVLPTPRLAIPWAKQSEIKEGKATIYTVLSGNKVEAFQIEITQLHPQASSALKGIEFRVNDDRLASLTNGIIQGMSGSPIVQDGKLIGAVTHVVTSDPMKGYGVYVEWMMDHARNPSG